MKCLKCDKEIDDGIYCSECEALEELGLDLPELKDEKENSDVEIKEPLLEVTEPTKAINVENEISELDLIDDINKQINQTNLEAQEDIIEEHIDKEQIEEDLEKDAMIFESDDSQKKRKKILKVASVFTVIALLLGVVSLYLLGNNKNSDNYDYMGHLEKGLSKYYENGKTNEIIDVLEYVKEDDDKLSEVQDKTSETVIIWLEDYLNKDVGNKDEFQTVTDEYKKLLDSLYDETMVLDREENEIRVLKIKDYKSLSSKINDIYEDSKTYYEALDFYNNKSYNEAYYMFKKVENDSEYYEKSNDYLERIVEDVIALLNSDIRKIELGIESLTDDQKLKVYNQIEDVINKYGSIYNNLGLNNEVTYKEILVKYQNLVNEYNTKVSNGGSENVTTTPVEEEKDETTETEEVVESEQNELNNV